MKITSAAYRVYNANAQNRNTTDCVIRALSLVYDLDYRDVHNELNRIKRDEGFVAFNSFRTYATFLRRHGFESTEDISDIVTVDEFADAHPDGTYCVHCKNPTGSSTHMVAILDGTIYDSWDSRYYNVTRYWCISRARSGANDSVDDIQVTDMRPEIERRVQSYLDSLNRKADFMTASIAGWEVSQTPMTDFLKIAVKVDISKVPESFRLKDNENLWKWFTLKMSPRKTLEDNVAANWKKLSIDLREFLYGIRKSVQDAIRETDIIQNRMHPNFYGDSRLLAKLPDWVIPLTTHLVRDSFEGESYLSLEMDCLPEDPFADEGDYVNFEAPNIPILRKELELYRTKYWRYNEDYGVDGNAIVPM